jgi:hypothetical protein
MISSSWKVLDGGKTVSLTVSLPVGVTAATVRGGTSLRVTCLSHSFPLLLNCAEHVRELNWTV